MDDPASQDLSNPLEIRGGHRNKLDAQIEVRLRRQKAHRAALQFEARERALQESDPKDMRPKRNLLFPEKDASQSSAAERELDQAPDALLLQGPLGILDAQFEGAGHPLSRMDSPVLELQFVEVVAESARSFQDHSGGALAELRAGDPIENLAHAGHIDPDSIRDLTLG